MKKKILPILFFTVSFLMCITTILYGFTNKLRLLAVIFVVLWFIIALFSLLVAIIEGIIAKKLFKKAGNDVPSGLYNHYILSVYENDFVNARIYYEKLMHIRLKKFRNQQETAKVIQEMIDSNEYNETIYNSTRFELIKEICLRYKNKEKID